MGRRHKSGGTGLTLVALGLLGLIELATQQGHAFLILGGIVGAVWLGCKLIAKSGLSGQAASGPPQAASEIGARSEQFRLGAVPTLRPDLHKDPRPFWVDAGSNVTVQGRTIGGMVYVGQGLASLGADRVEPALIDPTLPAVGQLLDLSQPRTNYWPSYSTSSAEARGAYLQWLSSGRKDPSAEVGLVFLYFYGLERRALADAATVEVPATEIEAIRAEVQRLLGIYTSGSFQLYARGFLDVLEVKSLPGALYRRPPPQSSHFELRHKVGLAQCAQDGAPLPADWAVSWIECDTSERLPTAATRCKSEFRRLFAIRYAENYGQGLILPRNKTKLRFDYHAASASFRGWNRSLAFGFDLPDVTVLTSPVKRLRAIAESCCEDLAGYSRRRAKAGADPDGLECIAELPYALWPEKYRSPVEKICALVTASGQPLAVPFETVQRWMPSHAALGKTQWRGFVRRLAEAGLGVEPDPAAGGPVPVADTRVAFFFLGTEGRAEVTSGRYRAAALTLQLAVAVASADGLAHLDRSALIGRLEERLHLAATEKTRLSAHLRRVLAEAPKITGLKAQLKAMDKAARKTVGTFVVSVAEADGTVTKAERRMLERIYKLLELDPTSLPAITPEEPRVVVAAGEPEAGHPIRSPTSAFVLDPIRVRERQAESERVAALLTGIFNADDEETGGPAPEASDEAVEHVSSVPGLWGLDAEHSDLAKQLFGRAHWSRAELEELAGDRQIMLDGALETINEACLDTTGQALLEGYDPVEVNRDLAHTEQTA